MISAPGYYEISMPEYLADPCPAPGLSSKIVGALWRQTAQKAMRLHPKLSKTPPDMTPRADIGSAVHALAHGGHPVKFGDFKDWRTDASKEFRDTTREGMAIPLLNKDRLGVEAAAGAIQMAINDLGPGKHEQSMVWQLENGVWCRGRADWLSDGPIIRPDLEIDAPNGVDSDTKTVDNADAVSWIKSTLYNGDLDVQIGLRYLAHIALGGKPRKMLWLLAEYEAPYDTCWVGASEEVIDLAVRKVKHAAEIWKRCLDTQKWPANSRKVQWASPPTWAVWELENRGVL